MRQLSLTEEQIIALTQQVRTSKSTFVLRRALACLELYRGTSIWAVSSMLQVSYRTVYRWAEQVTTRSIWAAWGPVDLIDHGGRPNRWDEEFDEIIEVLLSYTPDQFGYSCTSWTTPLIRAHFFQWFGEKFSNDTIARRLHELGYVWKRARYVLDPDPKRSQKMRKIREKVEILNKNKRSVILFLDETDILLFPPLRSTWVKKGAPAKVPISGWNDKRVVFGAINYKTGHASFLSRSRHCAEDFHMFLKMLRSEYRGWKLTIITDEHKSHTAVSTRALCRTLKIQLLWLPHRSPELNPMDTLWGKAKDITTKNHQCDSIDEQVDLFLDYLLTLAPVQLLVKAGIQSNRFWLQNF